MPDVKTDAIAAAERVLAEYWGDSVPVDPARIAHKMGIRVENAYLDADVAGAIEKRHGGDVRIYLNAEDHSNRKRFTCAHEIGHFVQHGDEDFEFVDYRDMTASLGVDADERYANSFAAALLMPEKEVRRLHALGMSQRDMKEVFGVSEAALVNRLKNLGLYR
ncbi:MAG: ImmA/IrrE family metallo-endopeptidase [Solirubrobacterales bacterium]